MNNMKIIDDGAVTKSSTTSFLTETVSRTTMLGSRRTQYNKATIHAHEQQSLADFMAKPILVTSSELTTGSPANTELNKQPIGALLSQTMWADKISGYTLVRGTACCKVTVNANPFQQGRLLLHYLPFVSNYDGTDGTNNMMSQGRNGNLCAKTQHPNVEMDIHDGSMILKIPYLAPSEWYDVNDGVFDWGTFYLDVLSPLQVGTAGAGGNTVGYDIFYWFEDFEYSAPTNPQSGLTKFASPESTEQDGIADGPISSALNEVSKVATVLGDVPVLSSVAKPTAWAARFGSKLASAFGYSKPNIDTTCNAIVQRPFRNMANSEGQTQAEPLSLGSNPLVATSIDFGGTNLDEMSFDYIKTRKAFWQSLTWNNTDADGTVLLSTSINPSTAYNQESTAVTGYTMVSRNYAPYGLLSKCFHFWRGSIHVTLKMVKTPYHSGRIMITFVPNYNGASTAPTTSTSSYCLRQIVDIRERDEIEIELPYLLPTAWIGTNHNMGSFYIHVINKLKAPDNVQGDIKILVYTSGGPDFELSFPKEAQVVPVQTYSAFKFGQFLSPDEDIVYDLDSQISVQSGMNTNYAHPEQTDNLGGDISYGVITQNDVANPDECLNACEFGIGEKFTSLKQLVIRYSKVYDNGSFLWNSAYSKFYAFTQGYFSPNPSVSTGSPGAILGDMYSLISSGYALHRGGIRYIFSESLANGVNVTTSFDEADTVFATNTPDANSAVAFTNSWSLTKKNSSNFVTFNDVSKGVEVLVPQYNTCLSRPLFPAQKITANPSNLNGLGFPYQQLALQFKTAPTNLQVSRAGAEDTQFGLFIGFPNIFNSYS